MLTSSDALLLLTHSWSEMYEGIPYLWTFKTSTRYLIVYVNSFHH
jgi:hypothetical protein